jgi:hypothetical protein
MSMMARVTKKISISLPDELDQAARIAAAAEGLPVSTWLARAARRALADRAILADGRGAINEEITQRGPFVVTADEQAWVDAVVADAGLTSQPQRRAAS